MIQHPIQVITQSEGVETHLLPFKGQMGDDFDCYRGHIYRVLSYTLHILGPDTAYRPVIEVSTHHTC